MGRYLKQIKNKKGVDQQHLKRWFDFNTSGQYMHLFCRLKCIKPVVLSHHVSAIKHKKH